LTPHEQFFSSHPIPLGNAHRVDDIRRARVRRRLVFADRSNGDVGGAAANHTGTDGLAGTNSDAGTRADTDASAHISDGDRTVGGRQP
jgi:hypothetical protein